MNFGDFIIHQPPRQIKFVNRSVQEQCPVNASLEKAPRWRLAVASDGFKQNRFTNFTSLDQFLGSRVWRIISTHEADLELDARFSNRALSTFRFSHPSGRCFLTENMLASNSC